MSPHPPINGEPATPGRYGFGTTEAVDAMLTYLRNTNSDMTVMVAINVATLIRNSASNKITKADDVVTDVRRTMNSLANEIGELCNNKWKHRQHHILYYLIDQSRVVPSTYQRPHTGSSATLVNAATALFCKIVKPSDQTVGNCSAHLRIEMQARIPSYKGIRTALDNLVPQDSQVQLISHFPLDYHVVTGTKYTGWLYRSHTGQMVQLGQANLSQTVFKVPGVPFCPKTHVMLGDSCFIKGSADKESKKKLIELSQVGHWCMRTDLYIDNKIRENRFMLPYSLD